MTGYDWLLFFHLLSAFLFFSGGIVAGVLQIGALSRERPSEILTLLRLTRVGVVLVGVGSLGTLAFGIGLVVEIDEAGVRLERLGHPRRDQLEELAEVERRVDGRDRLRQEAEVAGGRLHPGSLSSPRKAPIQPL